MTKTPMDIALSYFGAEYNCVQSVLRSVLEHKGLYFDQAIYMSAGLGAGISFSGQQCGAVSGAIMAIGILVRKITSDLRRHRSITHRLSSEFIDKFKEKFETIRCDDLTGVDMSNEKAFEMAYEEGVFQNTCPKFVETTVRIIMDMFPD